MSQESDAFDFGIALEDSDCFLRGGDDDEGLRDGGGSEGGEMGLAIELKRDAMEGGVERWVLRVREMGEKGW